MSDRATVVLFPEGVFGPTNNCIADRLLHERLAMISSRLQASPRTAKAAELIERIALGG